MLRSHPENNSEYTFPFEGNWNWGRTIFTKNLRWILWIHFPVWRELKHKLLVIKLDDGFTALNTLSRLKGIETLSLMSLTLGLLFLWIHFPVWRELKRFTLSGKGLRGIRPTLNTLSRLKGIETWLPPTSLLRLLVLWIHFPVWRELKLLTVRSQLPLEQPFPLNTLSRLKGIETLRHLSRYCKFQFALNTLSRLKGIETDTKRFLERLVSSPLWIHFPVWRELKQRFLFSSFLSPFKSLNTLSRLKGIETFDHVIRQFHTLFADSEYTFPFEGNWNVSFVSAGRLFKPTSEYTFPFEGNWNIQGEVYNRTNLNALNTLSRLKGIETLYPGIPISPCMRISEYTFPFEGNWNGKLLERPKLIRKPLNTLSRLKGIETEYSHYERIIESHLWIHFPVWRELKQRPLLLPGYSIPAPSEYTFPFEGNWNTCALLRAMMVGFLWIHFPVWRELKLVDTDQPAVAATVLLWIHFPVWRELKRLISRCNPSSVILWIHFPVWRELKLISAYSSRTAWSIMFRYAFPFEGNWNLIFFSTKRELIRSSDTLSRLKGIETGSLRALSPRLIEVQIRFPVWRELKPAPPQSLFSQLRRSDTLSRLKGIETFREAMHCQCVAPTFRYAFPFEGNWNNCAEFPAKFLSTLNTLSRLKGIETLTTISIALISTGFRYAFPFEGNWNSGLILYKGSFLGSDTLSRLKGIETSDRSRSPNVCIFRSDTLSRLKGIETRRRSAVIITRRFRYAFPFEGNWNLMKCHLYSLFIT